MPAPTFVIGFPRSGTTLLADLLSRHSLVAVPPETRFAAAIHEHYRPAGLPKPVSPTAFVEGVLRTYPRLRDVNVDWHRVAQRMEQTTGPYEEDPSALMLAILEEYAEQQDKLYVVEKSPVHQLYAETLVEWFPACRFVWIIRDGRDAVLSLQRMPWAHDVLALHAAEWTYRMDVGATFLEAHPERVHIVRYEDLLMTPVPTLEALCAFLGIAFEPSMLNPEQGGSTVPDWERDWKGKATGQLDPSRVAGWKRTATPAQQRLLHAILGPTLDQWGYAVPARRGVTAALTAPLRMPTFRYVRSALVRSKALVRRAGWGVPLSRAHVVEEASRRPSHGSVTDPPCTLAP
ncbi:MAG: sulfotransferase [Bacteroidota bacterium]